ncbi:MAG: mercuric reductase [Chloroflexia bacterium]
MIEHYDAIVIGAGQSGGPLSTAFARAGHKTAIIERKYVGGTCINEGCTPTKTMVASARVAYLARRAEDYGVQTGTVTVDMVKVRQRKRDMVSSFRASSQRQIEEVKGVDLIFGQATFTSPKTVEVRLNAGGTSTLHADTIVINTGARPKRPTLEGLDGVPAFDSTTIMDVDKVPEHLLVIGGSYVGLEFAQMFRRFGSKVTVINRSARVLGHEDPDVAQGVTDILREDGVEVLLDTDPVLVRWDGKQEELEVSVLGTDRTITGSHLLLAVGRDPNTRELNLEATGVQTNNRGFIPVNERLETNMPGIYAVGDVNGGPAFTHISYDDFRILRTNLIEGGDATTTGRVLPYVVFTDPQLGRVGITEEEARTQNLPIKVAKMPMSYISRADEVDESRGFMKAIIDPETKQILGAAVLGLEGGELMAMLEIAILSKTPYTVLKNAIFAHPTLSEGLNTLFSDLE